MCRVAHLIVVASKKCRVVSFNPLAVRYLPTCWGLAWFSLLFIIGILSTQALASCDTHTAAYSFEKYTWQDTKNAILEFEKYRVMLKNAILKIHFWKRHIEKNT